MVNVLRILENLVDLQTWKIFDGETDELFVPDDLKPAEIWPDGLKVIKNFNLVEQRLQIRFSNDFQYDCLFWVKISVREKTGAKKCTLLLNGFKMDDGFG
jgi:hypothetical protein